MFFSFFLGFSKKNNNPDYKQKERKNKRLLIKIKLNFSLRCLLLSENVPKILIYFIVKKERFCSNRSRWSVKKSVQLKVSLRSI